MKHRIIQLVSHEGQLLGLTDNGNVVEVALPDRDEELNRRITRVEKMFLEPKLTLVKGRA